jgi:predicted RNase H-like HicB family nuclease
MQYPIAIETGDEKHAYGVVVPDLPGCFSAGDTLDEALTNARETMVDVSELGDKTVIHGR